MLAGLGIFFSYVFIKVASSITLTFSDLLADMTPNQYNVDNEAVSFLGHGLKVCRKQAVIFSKRIGITVNKLFRYILKILMEFIEKITDFLYFINLL